MKTDDILGSWKKGGDVGESGNEEQLTGDQIAERLEMKGRSDAVLGKILRNSRRSLAAVVVMYGVITAGLFLLISPVTALLLWLGVTVFLAYAFLQGVRHYRRIKEALAMDVELKTSLERTIPVMERYLRFGMGTLYKYVLIPAALVLGVVIGIYIGAGERGFLETVRTLETSSIVKIILVIVVGSAVTIPLSQLAMKRQYRDHLDELRECLGALDELNGEK